MNGKISITKQFTILALLGVFLTITALSLTLKRTYDQAYDAKRAEIQHETEEGASIVRYFVQQEQSGALTREEAQERAKDAIGAIRFQKVNYVALLGFDGVSISNANKSLIGKNIIDLQDPMGHPVTRAQLAIATSGIPGFAEFYWKKIGEANPKLKMSFNIGVPEWKMDVTAGDFADDLDTMLIDGVTRMSEIFVPLFLSYLTIVYLMRRSLSRLLGSLADTMRRLAEGDHGTEISGLDRRDEIGRMASALQVFKQAGVDKLAMEREAETGRERANVDRLRGEKVKAEAAQELAEVVDGIGRGLDQLAKGTLTFRLNQSFSADYEKLRIDFNDAMAKLADTLTIVAANTSAIRSGTGEISTAADDLSRRTEQQAASLEETAAALDEVTATVRRTSQSASHARDVVGAAKTDAERSGAVVRQTVEAMSGIERSAREISQIIGVIDEIAFQTNLLALNAGVEAARAGDAGRGFAVVASEVRALAQRSAEAAKEINSLISASGRQVAQGVELVAETGKALDRILVQVADINTIVTEIAASAQEQASGLDQINTAINQMDQVTQQNAAMVEESTAASHALSRETEELSSLVGRFQLGDGHNAPAPTATRRVPAPAKTTQRTVGMLKSVGRGGAARAPAPAADADWADF